MLLAERSAGSIAVRHEVGVHGPSRVVYWAVVIWLATGWGSGACADSAPPSARLLGMNESMLNFCAPLDPTAAARLRQKIGKLVEGASASQLAEVRNSDEYREAYDAVSEFAGKIDSHNVAKFCAENAGDRK